MTEQSKTYHYRAYLETLLNYSREEGATKLAPQGWVNQLNVIEEMEATGANSDTHTNANWSGNAELRALTTRLLSENWHTFIIRPHEKMGPTGANSDTPTNANWCGNAELRALTTRLLSENWHTFIIRPHLPPLKTGECLVPGVQLDFELFLNPNTVYLMGTPNKGTLNTKKFPAIHNEDIKVTLLMRKVTLNASVYVRLQKERQLGKKIVRYPVVRSEIRTFSFDGRTTQWPELYRCYKRCMRCTMEPEMVSTLVDNTPAFLQLRDKY